MDEPSPFVGFWSGKIRLSVGLDREINNTNTVLSDQQQKRTLDILHCEIFTQNEIEDEIHLLFQYMRQQFIPKQAQILNCNSFDDYKKLSYIFFTTS